VTKWENLIEAEADARLRELERKAVSAGGLDNWVAYRMAGRARGIDPVRDPISELFKDAAELKRRLGLPAKLPLDLEGDYSLTHDGRKYYFKVNVSRTSGGTGSRMKMECPMCGNYVGAGMSQFGHHLNSKDHGGLPKDRSFRQLWPSIRSKLNKRVKELGIGHFRGGWGELFVYAHSSKKDDIVAFITKEFPLYIKDDDEIPPRDFNYYREGGAVEPKGRPLRRDDRKLIFRKFS